MIPIDTSYAVMKRIGLKGYCPCCGAEVYWNKKVIHNDDDHCTLDDMDFNNFEEDYEE